MQAESSNTYCDKFLKGPISLKDYFCFFFSVIVCLVQGSSKPLRHHCTKAVLQIPCFSDVLVNIQEWEDQHKVHTLLLFFGWERTYLKISLTNFAFHFIASVSYKIHTSLPFLVLKSTSTLKKETCWIARWKVSSSAMAWTKILLFSQLWFRNLILFIEIICFKSLFVCMFD